MLCNKKIRVKDILSVIPDSELNKLSAETEVDKHVKKIKGKYIFSLFIYSFLESPKQSLGKMANIFNSFEFKCLTGISTDSSNTYKSTLSARLQNINFKFFENIFGFLSSEFQHKLSRDLKDNISKFDSTIITLSSRLLGNIGYAASNQNGLANKNQIKFTVGITNNLPKTVKIYDSRINEEVALKETVLSHSNQKDDIIIFDRGLSSRKSYKYFCDKDISFVTRVNDNVRHLVVSNNKIESPVNHDNITIMKDEKVKLFAKQQYHPMNHEFRLIQVRRINDGKKLCFLTNRFDLSAEEISDIYKKRWEIEYFSNSLSKI